MAPQEKVWVRERLENERRKILANDRRRRQDLQDTQPVRARVSRDDYPEIDSEEGATNELSRIESETLRSIEAALQRLEDGTYGICVTCEDPISAVRLEALPYTVICINCAERRASGKVPNQRSATVRLESAFGSEAE